MKSDLNSVCSVREGGRDGCSKALRAPACHLELQMLMLLHISGSILTISLTEHPLLTS